MKIILLEDVKSLGKKGEVVKASDAYARNVLFPKKLAVEANNVTLNDLKLRQRHKEKVEQENLDHAKELAQKLENASVEVKIKAGEGGKVFGSVSTKEISSAVKAQLGFDLDKKKMQLEEPIKSLGVHEVSVRLHTKVFANLKVHVVEE